MTEHLKNGDLERARPRLSPTDSRRRLLVAALGAPMILATSAQTARANGEGTNTSSGTSANQQPAPGNGNGP